MNQEIYVKEMPKSCVCCKFFAQHRRQCEINLGFEWNEEKQKYNDCPLTDIKTHDRELVKEVCDDLALSLVEFSEDFAMSRDEILEWLQKYKDQIQKEYEK